MIVKNKVTPQATDNKSTANKGEDYSLETEENGLKTVMSGKLEKELEELKGSVLSRRLDKIQIRYKLEKILSKDVWSFLLALLDKINDFSGERLRVTLMAHHMDSKWDLWYKKCRHKVIGFNKCSGDKAAEFLIFIEIAEVTYFLKNSQVQELLRALAGAKWLAKVTEFTLYIHGEEEIELSLLNSVFDSLNQEKLSVLRFFIYSTRPDPTLIHPLIERLRNFRNSLEELAFCFASDKTYTDKEVELLKEALREFIGKKLNTLRVYVGSQRIGPIALESLMKTIAAISNSNNGLRSLNLSLWNDNFNIEKNFYEYLFELLASLKGVYHMNLAFICIGLDDTIYPHLVNMYKILASKGLLRMSFYSQSDGFGGNSQFFKQIMNETACSSVLSADFVPERIGLWYDNFRGEHQSSICKIQSLADKRLSLLLMISASYAKLRSVFKRRLIYLDFIQKFI